MRFLIHFLRYFVIKLEQNCKKFYQNNVIKKHSILFANFWCNRRCFLFIFFAGDETQESAKMHSALQFASDGIRPLREHIPQGMVQLCGSGIGD